MAAAVVVEDIEVCFEEAMSWLPSHVLDDAVFESKRIKKEAVKHHYHRHRSKLPTDHQSFPPQSKGGWRRHDQKPRNWGISAPGGGGMQAFFLDSGNKSTGTGVFLPQTQRIGPNNNPSHSTRRPTCSPVLLPSRVVQALNLNVHQLGLQISPRPDPRKKKNNNSRRVVGDELNSINNNKNGKDLSTKRSSPTDVFLPDEWTY